MISYDTTKLSRALDRQEFDVQAKDPSLQHSSTRGYFSQWETGLVSQIRLFSQ